MTEPKPTPAASVIIPAHNEAGYLAPTLDALFASDLKGQAVEAIVVANGCTDATAEIARGYGARAEAAGWQLQVVDTPEGGKPGALDLGEAQAVAPVLIYLDADVIVSPGLIAALSETLSTDRPLYASGRPHVTRSPSWVTRAYARFWTRLPFVQTRAPGFGLFAMNRAGRARWGGWPRIIGDDAFARLMFAPEERVEVAGGYDWPPVDGFPALVRVRRRQDAGVREIAALHPELEANEDKGSPGATGTARLFLRDPVGWLVYAAVKLASRLPSRQERWARGR